MSRVIQRMIDAGLEGEAAVVQAALTQLARGEDVTFSPEPRRLGTQALRRSGRFAPPPRDAWLGLRRPSIG